MPRTALVLMMVACGTDPDGLPQSPPGEADATLADPPLPSCVGLIDPTFGSAGVVVTGSEVPFMVPRAAAFDSTDRLVVVGQTSKLPHQMVIARFATDGTLDPTLSTDGIAIPEIGSDADATGVAIDSDGTLLVTGIADGVAVLARFTAAGELDTSFAGGYVYLGASVPVGIGLVEAGIVVAANSKGGDGMIAFYRRTRTGVADPDFGTNGTAQDYFDYSPGDETIGAFGIDPMGRLLVGINGGATIITRYTSNGARDGTFGASAGSAFPFVNATGFAGIMGQASGRVVVGANTSGDGTMMLGLLEHGAPDSGATDPVYAYVRLPVQTSMHHMVPLANDSVLLSGDIANHFVGIRVTANGQYDGCWATENKVGSAAAAAVDSQGRFTIVGFEQLDAETSRVLLARLVP